MKASDEPLSEVGVKLPEPPPAVVDPVDLVLVLPVADAVVVHGTRVVAVVESSVAFSTVVLVVVALPELVVVVVVGFAVVVVVADDIGLVVVVDVDGPLVVVDEDGADVVVELSGGSGVDVVEVGAEDAVEVVVVAWPVVTGQSAVVVVVDGTVELVTTVAGLVVVDVVLVVGVVLVLDAAVTEQQGVPLAGSLSLYRVPVARSEYTQETFTEKDAGLPTHDAGKLIPYVLALVSYVATTPEPTSPHGPVPEFGPALPKKVGGSEDGSSRIIASYADVESPSSKSDHSKAVPD